MVSEKLPPAPPPPPVDGTLVCGVRKKSAVSSMSYQEQDENKCSVPGRSHLQYEYKVVQFEESVCNIRRATSGITGCVL